MEETDLLTIILDPPIPSLTPPQSEKCHILNAPQQQKIPECNTLASISEKRSCCHLSYVLIY